MFTLCHPTAAHHGKNQSPLSTQQGIENSYADSALEMYIMTLKSDIELFKQRLPFPIYENNTCPVCLRIQIGLAAKHALNFLLMQLHTIELFLYQISLLNRNSGSENNTTCLSSWPLWRLEILRSGLASAKLLFDTDLSLPSRTEMTFNNTEWVQLGFALTVASKFSVAGKAQSVSAKTMSLRRSLDISGVLKQNILRTRALISSKLDADGERDVFFHYEKRAMTLQCWLKKKLLEQPELLTDGVHQFCENSSQLITPSLQMRTGDNTLNLCTQISDIDDGLRSDQAHDLQMPDYFPEETMDGIFGDWITYPMLPFS